MDRIEIIFGFISKKRQGATCRHSETGATVPLQRFSIWRLSMNFNEEIVTQAKASVNARIEGKNARVPAIKFCFWQQFMTTVLYELELAGKI